MRSCVSLQELEQQFEKERASLEEQKTLLRQQLEELRAELTAKLSAANNEVAPLAPLAALLLRPVGTIYGYGYGYGSYFFFDVVLRSVTAEDCMQEHECRSSCFYLNSIQTVVGLYCLAVLQSVVWVHTIEGRRSNRYKPVITHIKNPIYSSKVGTLITQMVVKGRSP